MNVELSFPLSPDLDVPRIEGYPSNLVTGWIGTTVIALHLFVWLDRLLKQAFSERAD